MSEWPPFSFRRLVIECANESCEFYGKHWFPEPRAEYIDPTRPPVFIGFGKNDVTCNWCGAVGMRV